MSGARSRNKGAAAERELLKLLGEELGVMLQRNIAQTRAGGADCLELKGFAVEIKRQESLSRPKWWAQAVEQGERIGSEPILFYRRNREPWSALVSTLGGYREVAFVEAVSHIREKWLRWP